MQEMNLTVKLVLLLTPLVSALVFFLYFTFKVQVRRNFVRMPIRGREAKIRLAFTLLGFIMGILIDGFIYGTFDTFLGLTDRVM